jgi:hypothetical protein
LKCARVVNSPDQIPDEPGQTLVTTNHEVIRRWAQARSTAASSTSFEEKLADGRQSNFFRLESPGPAARRCAHRGVAVLAALSCVDHVIVFTENTPAALIEAIRPDLYVKGGDYHPDTVPEAPLVRRFGGDVQTLDYLPDRSTSAVIERIHSRAPVPRPSTIDATA